MDLNPQIYFQNITNSIQKPNGHLEAFKLLDSLNRYLIEEQIDSTLIDIYLPHFFHSKNCLLQFVDNASKNKNLKKACMKALEILYTILNNFFLKIPEKDILSLYRVGLTFFRSTSIDSYIKTKVFDLVLKCLEKSDGYIEADARLVFKDLITSLTVLLRLRNGDMVKGKEMELIGYLAKKFSYFIDNPNTVKTNLWYNFETTCALVQKKVSQNVLFGFFMGFGYYLESFPLDMKLAEDKKKVEHLYRTLKHLVILRKEEKIKIGNRAAISFLTTYCSMFQDYLFKEYKYWHDKLLSWLTFSLEEKKVGATALQAYYQLLAKSLVASDDLSSEEIIRYFLSYCKNVLNTKEALNFEKRLSVFCLREFSSASLKHLDKNEVTDTFLIMMQLFENTFVQEYNEEWEYLPDYVQTIANFMRFIKFTPSEFFCLQKGVISMVKSFHKLPVSLHYLVIDSMLLTMFYLKDTHYFDTFIENVVYQGVVWSCSHQHISVEVFLENPLHKLVTVKNYFNLWEGILKLSSYRQYDKHEFYLEDRRYILERIINELIKTLMILINKLNVAVKLKEEDTALTDLEKAYKTEETNDYAIFLNVVDFYKKIFECIEPKYFKKCVCKMIDHIISKSLKNPLTSGFYKLLSYCLKITKQLSLFNKNVLNHERENCRETLVSFLTVLLNKMVEFKDDLLISCLQVLLETPVEIVENMLDCCVTPFVNIFEVGRSYLPLAEMGVHTLEYWQENLKGEALESFLGKIIPSLDSFLRSKFLRGYSAEPVQKRRKTLQALKKRKVSEETEPELVKLQKKILCFIGRQSLKTCQNFIFSDGMLIKDFISGQSSHLKITLPYEDLQLDMYLDTFLPRIIELCLYCSDRKTRITSCELLQACVMVFLGSAKQMAKSGLEELNTMLKTIVRSLLLLSCDIDQVVRQIFEPLFLQLIHWYTSPTQSCGIHTSIIIEAMMEGITHPTNSNLKDFSGKCVNEFVKWTIKHQNLEVEVSIKVLVKNIQFFSCHPDPAKKLGAALIFNDIYRELREEDRIVSIFWLEILHTFVLSLDSVYVLEETTAVTQIKRALKHLQRVIMEKPSVFRETDKKRRVPNELEQGLLTDVSKWLLRQTSSKSAFCREACMDLFVNITPMTTTRKLNLHEFIDKYLDVTVSSLYDTRLIRFSSLREESYIDCANLFNYLRNLLCCIDGYIFMVKNNLETVSFDKSIFTEIQMYLKHLQNVDLNTALNLIENKTWIFTTLDKDAFVSLKSACVLSILKLFNAVIHNELLCSKGISLWSDHFWRLVASMMFSPQDVGFNEITNSGYSDILVILLNSLPGKLPMSLVNALQKVLEQTIDRSELIPINLEKIIPLKQRNVLKGIILLKNFSIGREMALYEYANVLVDKFFKDFFVVTDGDTIFVTQIKDTMFNYALSLFKFFLSSENGLEKIISPLHSDLYVQSNDVGKKVGAGLYILKTFDEAFVPVVCEKFGEFLKHSLDQKKTSTTVDMVIYVLSRVVKEKKYKKSYSKISKELLDCWDYLMTYFTSSCDSSEMYLEFLKLMMEVCDYALPAVQDSLIDCLVKDQGNNHLEIFGLIVKTTDTNINEDQSDGLKVFLTILNEKITSQTKDKQIIANSFISLLRFLPVVKSTIIFKYLVETYIKTNPNTEIQPLLEQLIKNLSITVQETFLEYVYNMVLKESEHRYKIATDIMPTIFQNCSADIFEQFFVNNIQNILAQYKENNLQISTINFLLIDILFLRIPIGTPERTDCAITAASGKTKLLPELLGCCLNAFKINGNKDELARKYKCHAYNASVSIICNSVKKPELYNKLFVREDNGQDILWHGIVNTEINYNFSKDFDSLPTRKKVLVNIRDELRRNRLDTTSESLKYIESQRLFNSSLSEDVTKFDFTNSVLRTERTAEKKIAENIQMQSEIYLEMTEINNHECMSTVCSLIQHIFDNDICHLPVEGEDDVKLPTWMSGMRSLLLSNTTHKNVKIFLVKIIDNMVDIFSNYAKWFLEPLIRFVVDNSAGNTINYFVTDVLVIISKWSSLFPNLSETESELASNLLKFFLKNLENDRQEVFKYNIELLKLMVESWNRHFEVPVDTIFELFSTQNTSEVAIYVSSVLLINGLDPWERGKELQFLDKMLAQLDANKRQTYRACAETLGPLLLNLQDPEYVNKVNSKLETIRFISFEKYVVCLEGISIKFPLIVSMYHAALLISSLNQVPVAQKIVHLKIINKRTEISLDILEETSDFKIINWQEHIEDSNLDVQILSLEIVKKCLKYIVNYPDFNKIVETMFRNVYHPNAIFRASLFDLAIAIYNIKRDDTGTCKEILILGLVDADLNNQQKVSDFWTENSVLPATVIDRFSFLLSELYKTKIEDKLLGLATYFLIHLLSNGEKYGIEIFDHPLEDCDFEEYKLYTNWKLQHPSVVPMFAETLDISTMESSTLSRDGQDVFALRRTQTTFQFAPTQSFQEQQLLKYTSLESTLGVDLDPTFKDPNNVGISQKYKTSSKKRFLKDKSKISQMMARYETYKQVKQSQARQESVHEREKNVIIYRSYRKGDFPDIQIPLSSILKPLQMLALNDGEISKILFLEIFKGLSSKTENNQQFLLTVSEAIKKIFNTSIQFNQYLFGALLDILLKNKDKMYIDTKLISYVALESNLVSTGALLIEEYIISGIEGDGPSTSKRTFREDNKETTSWVKLAELYKEIEEWDTVRAIFLEKMECKDSLQKAIIYESQCLYKVAADLYKDLIVADQSQNRRDFYYDSYFKCFANLGEWGKIPHAIASVVEHKNIWKGLWQDEWSKQKLLPWYITSQVKNQLFTEEINTEFLTDLNDSLMDSKNGEYLNQHFSEELCMLWLCEKDIQTANQYLRSSVKNFLEDWQVLNPMFQSQRFHKLLKLQNVIEISDFLEISNSLSDDIDLRVKRLIDRWLFDTNETFPSLLLVETKLLYRKQFITTLSDKLLKLQGVDETRNLRELKKCKILMDIDLINKAADFGNFFMTKKYMKDYLDRDNPRLNVAKGTVHALKASMAIDTQQKINHYIEGLKVFEKILLTATAESVILTSSGKLFDTVIDLNKIFSNDNALFSENRQKLSNFIEGLNVYSDLEKYAYNVFKSSAEKCNIETMDCDSSNDQKVAQNCNNLSDAYVKLAHYVRDHSDESRRGDFILFVLRAMKMNSSEARQLFPCILIENDLGTTHKNLFIREVEKIPTWMFLGWIPQLLANVDSMKLFAISEVIKRIAETYPQAIMYPYRLSKDNYKFNDDEVTAEAKLLINRLDELLLKDEKINTFLKALSYISVPANILKYHLNKLLKQENQNDIETYLQFLKDEIFDQNCDSKNINYMQGNAFIEIKKLRKEFSKMSGLTTNKLENFAKTLDVQLKYILAHGKNSTLLKDYSPWLANFSANKLNVELEVPGQYEGHKLPLPQHHVKISGFYPEVKIMESLRKPMKITILGLDTKEYPFLIKFGEDIRQDQRIEQLFNLINNILKSDPSCANNGLDILTYQIIPLTSSLGLIQWINDTQPLSDFIEKSLSNKREKVDELFKKQKREYHRNLNISENQKNYLQAYGSAAEKIRKERLTVNFMGLVKKIPWDVLRSSFWMLSTSTENYIALRNNFIKTYSTMCAAHWILGIGDRHLVNSLINLRNGKVLGIDFGHAFGTSTQILEVPELVPFRLTPHIISLMEPLKEKGSFRENMIHCLRCLRESSSPLLAAMNVFIQEPSIDWCERSGNEDWYPLVKIEQARKKLKGANSVDVTAEELNANAKIKRFKNAYVKIVNGEESENFRAKLIGRGDLSVEDQVDCLIDHATDYNLLGRMWVGWLPWV